MIRVLHFVSIPATWSGVMNVIMNYYRHLEHSEIQFDFLCFIHCRSEAESYEKEIRELGGNVTYIEKPGSSWKSICELRNFLKQNAKNFDWFHNHEVYLSFILKPLSAHYGLKNFIIHCHATQYSDRSIASLRNRIFCFPILFMKCKYFACSRDAGYFLYGKKQMESNNVFIMQNAIEVGKYQFDETKRYNLRKKYHLENSFVLGHIGRLEPQKNHFFLLEVFRRVFQKYPESKLLLIGDGSLKKQLEKKITEYGMKNAVLFLGVRNDIPDLLQVMDMFLLPSFFEGVGISLLEAQANGLGCIASNKVPRDVSINNHITFLPIQNSNSMQEIQVEKVLDMWLNEIENNRHNQRELEVITAMLESPYNIEKAVRELIKQYKV